MKVLHKLYDVVVTLACIVLVIKVICLNMYVDSAEKHIKMCEEMIDTERAYLDTCHQRNERIYDELFRIQNERIIELNNTKYESD